MGQTARSAVPALTALLSQTSVPLLPEAQKVIDDAAKFLKMSPGGGINVAVDAALALERIEPGKTPARELLLATLQDKKTEFWYRLDAAAYLATKSDNKTALELVIAHVQHSDQRARSQAANALVRLGRPEAVPQLIEDLKFDNQRTRLGAAAAPGKLGPAAKSAIPALVAASEQLFDAALRKEARKSLEGIQKK